MTAHRCNFTPAPAPRAHWHLRLAALLVAIGMAIGVAVLYALLRHSEPPASATRVRVVTMPALGGSDARDLAQIRIDAFRAGYDSALQDGCRPARLGAPVTQVRP